jgi:hypothetical protein
MSAGPATVASCQSPHPRFATAGSSAATEMSRRVEGGLRVAVNAKPSARPSPPRCTGQRRAQAAGLRPRAVARSDAAGGRPPRAVGARPGYRMGVGSAESACKGARPGWRRRSRHGGQPVIRATERVVIRATERISLTAFSAGAERPCAACPESGVSRTDLPRRARCVRLGKAADRVTAGRRHHRAPIRMIDLPFWSTLMLELDALCSTTGDDQKRDTPPLSSADANASALLIMRPPTSGL